MERFEDGERMKERKRERQKEIWFNNKTEIFGPVPTDSQPELIWP